MEICVDLETGGTSQDAAILALACQAFDPYDPSNLPDPLVLAVEPEENDKYERTWSGATIQWWSRQPEALSILSSLPISTLPRLARLFTEYCVNNRVTAIWANSPSFDLAILRHLYCSLEMRFPLSYWQERNIRTIKALLPAQFHPPFIGIKHHPLDDVLHEIRIVHTFLSIVEVPTHDYPRVDQLPGDTSRTLQPTP